MVFPKSRMPILISPVACLLFALLILVLPIQWLFAATMAAAFHELSHYVAVRLCNGRMQTLQIGGRGAQMRAEINSSAKELICTLAGSIGGLLLLFFVRYIPRIAICAAVHSLYNLLPFPQLDGGRALGIILRMIHPANAKGIFIRLQQIFIAILWITAVWLSFFCRFGIMPLIFAFSLSTVAKKTLQTMTEKGTIV